MRFCGRVNHSRGPNPDFALSWARPMQARRQVRLNREWRVYSHGSGVLQSPWLPYPPPCHETLIKPFDDADVAHRAVIECFERILISRALVSGDGFLDAGEFRHHDALLLAGLEGGRCRAARQIAAAERRDRRRRQLGIGGELLRGGNRARPGIDLAGACPGSNIQRRKRGGRFMSFWSALFGGRGAAAEKVSDPVEYK